MNDNGDVISDIIGESENMFDSPDVNLLRVSQAYWKSQRKLGHLVKVTEDGDVLNEIVTEDYKITDKPIYDDRLFKNKNKETLLFGDIKCSSNRPAWKEKDPSA